jgi:hypothetical protein
MHPDVITNEDEESGRKERPFGDGALARQADRLSGPIGMKGDCGEEQV